MTEQRYPLRWPQGWARTRVRGHARFAKRRAMDGGWKKTEALTVGDALDRLLGELRRLGATHVVISSNLELQRNGLPYANQPKRIDDPGVAVYFRLNSKPRVLACDRWVSAAENIAAIAGHIQAIRMQDRYGVGSIEQAFAGYTAIPQHASPGWVVLEFQDRQTSVDVVKRRYFELVKKYHPDVVGGSAETIAKINAARDAALLDLGESA